MPDAGMANSSYSVMGWLSELELPFMLWFAVQQSIRLCCLVLCPTRSLLAWKYLYLLYRCSVRSKAADGCCAAALLFMQGRSKLLLGLALLCLADEFPAIRHGNFHQGMARCLTLFTARLTSLSIDRRPVALSGESACCEGYD